MSKSKITKDMTIQEVVDKYPKSVPVFMAHGLHCVGCHASNWESVAQGAAGHGIDVDPLMKDLQEIDKEE
jgi:hybrid cluster-associated redox disulfide protein